MGNAANAKKIVVRGAPSFFRTRRSDVTPRSRGMILPEVLQERLRLRE
jgi:hypothetical protein